MKVMVPPSVVNRRLSRVEKPHNLCRASEILMGAVSGVVHFLLRDTSQLASV